MQKEIIVRRKRVDENRGGKRKKGTRRIGKVGRKGK